MSIQILRDGKPVKVRWNMIALGKTLNYLFENGLFEEWRDKGKATKGRFTFLGWA